MKDEKLLNIAVYFLEIVAYLPVSEVLQMHHQHSCVSNSTVDKSYVGKNRSPVHKNSNYVSDLQ